MCLFEGSLARSAGADGSGGGGSGGSNTAANAVTTYMTSLKARAAAAATQGRLNSGGGGSRAPQNAGRSQAASAPDAKTVVDAYLADLKSRSAQVPAQNGSLLSVDCASCRMWSSASA